MARSRELKVVLTGDPSSLNRAFAKAGKGADSMGSRVSRAAKVAGVALGGGLAVALKKSVDAFAEAEKVSAQTNAVLKSTGQAANVTSKQVSDLATALSRKSGFDDEAIQSGENLLLTFTRIRNETGKGNDIFNQATSTLVDMSVALGQDTKSSAIQLGKALNDPIRGVTALRRVGVSFTESQQKQIKTLVESGKTLDAQKLILKELQVEFGGSAEAAGNTFAGKINKAKVAVGNLGEAIGGPLAGALGSAAQGMADFVTKLTTSERPARFFAGVGEQVANLKDAIGGVFDDFGKRKASGASFAAALGGTIADAVSDVNWSAVGDTMSAGFTKGADFTGKLAPAVATGISTALGQINGRDLLAGLFRVISEGINALFSPKFWVDNFAAIFSTVTIAIPVAKILKIPGADFLFRHISKPIFGAVGKLTSGLVGLFGRMGSSATTGFLASLERLAPRTANVLLSLVTGTGKWLGGLPGKFSGAAKAGVASMADGITRGAGRVGGAVGTLTGKIVSSLGKAASSMFRAGWDIAKSILNGIVRGIGAGIGKVGGAIKKGIGAVGGFLGIGEGIGKGLRPKMPKGGSASLKGANPALGPFAALGANAGLSVSSGLRGGAITSSGNVSYHSTGEAIDLAGSPNSMLSFARAMKARYGARLAELIYTPMGAGIRNGRPHTFSGAVAADHFDHVHLALDLGTPGPGIGPAGHFSKRPKVGDGEGKDVVSAFRRAIRRTKAPPKAALALFEAGIVESGLRNLTYGDRDSKGALQLRVSLHGEELAMDPYRSALAFLTRGFTGAGGAIALSSRLKTAGQVAQAVQGSAHPDRYDKVRARALAYLGKMAAGGRSAGGSGASGRSAAERGESAGAAIANAIVAPFMRDTPARRGFAGGRGARAASPGIRSLVKGATALGTQIEDEGTAYGQAERRFGQTDEDLGTAAGRTARVSEIAALRDLKLKTLKRQQARAAALGKAIGKYTTMLAKLNHARKKAKGAKRAKLNERIRTYEERLDELKAELKSLGFAIEDTKLDIGDLNKDEAEVRSTPDTEVEPGPSASDVLSQSLSDIDAQERAGLLTAEQAKAGRISYLQRAMGGEFGALSQRELWDVMGQLRDIEQQAVQAVTDNTSALRDLQKEIAIQNAIANSTIGIQLREATRALGDLVSGELGGRVHSRGTMPGSGALARL